MAADVATDRLELAPHAVCRETTNGLVMLFDRKKGVMYELNESAAAIVRMFAAAPRVVEDMVVELAETFEGDREAIREGLSSLVSDFVEAGLLRDASVSEG
ncbi:PqqD family protein [Kitasatospora sp. NPDC059088]|uniref:PqqD family protein n=1 Tax=Kitasatospora sp. NPDC059088 TaxID=3346722 RepID=UPI0036B53C72